MGFPGGSDGKKIRRLGFDPWVGKIPEDENGYSCQYSCLENSTDRGAWQATVMGSQSRTQLTNSRLAIRMSSLEKFLFKSSARFLIGLFFDTELYELFAYSGY